MKRTLRNACLSVVLPIVVAACNIGMQPRNYGPARTPAGERVAIRVMGEDQDRVGELFAVDSIGVTLHDNRLTRVSWSRLEAMDVPRFGDDFDVSRGEVVSREKRERIALVSRFPQGMSDVLLAQVLAALSLDKLDEIR